MAIATGFLGLTDPRSEIVLTALLLCLALALHLNVMPYLEP